MPKEVISVSVEKETANKIREIAKKEKRSFSQMVDVLLEKALDVIKKIK